MANRRQREDRRRRRRAHTRGDDRTPIHPIEPEDFEGGRPGAPPPLTRKQKVWNAISDVAILMQPVGVLVWLVMVLLHRGHLGAWIGAGVTLTGYGLIWATILVAERVLLKERLAVIIFAIVAPLTPSLGLITGALLTWWVGLVVGGGMLVWSIALLLVDPRPRKRPE